MRYRPDIQGLRAVAVMLVVADHLKIPGFKGGFLGVDVFFVISGFLITSLLAAEFERNRTKDSPGGISIKAFYLRRARRILPAGMLVIAAVLIAATLEFNVFRLEEVQSNAFWATLFLSNFDLMSQATDYFAQTNAASPLQNYWSLAVEEQFYIVWPLIFMLAARVGWTRRAAKTHDWGRQATIAILVITVLSLIWSLIATNANPSSAYFSPFTRAYELGIGATIAVLTPQIRALLTPNTSRALGLTGLGLLGVGLAVLTSSTPYPGLWALIPTLGAGALIAAGLASDDHNPAGTALSIAPAGFLGKISYSIYLWHWPIIVFAASMYPGLKGAGRVGVLLPLIIAVSWATYVLVEQPFRTYGKGTSTPRGFMEWLKSQGRNQTIKAGAMALAAAVTLLVVVTWARPAPSGGDTRPVAGSNVDKWAHWDSTASPAVLGAPGQSGDATPPVSAKGSGSLAGDGPGPARIKAITEGLKVKRANAQQLQAIRGVASDSPEWLECAQNQGPPAASCTRGGSSTGSQLSALKGKTSVLLGNSYAEQWAGTLARALPAGSQLTALTERGCVPFDLNGLIRPRSGSGLPCAKHATWAMNQIKKLKPALTVISTDKWPPTTQFSAYSAIREFIRQIQTSGTKILWIGTVPRAANWDSCLKGSNDISSCSTNDWNSSRLEPSALSAIGTSTVKFWNPEPLYCLVSGCPALINDQPVRLDGSHLTNSAMNSVLPQLTVAMQLALKQPAQPGKPAKP
ncbi:MAG: acyltransferase family protein [Actinomycetes bacterium]